MRKPARSVAFLIVAATTVGPAVRAEDTATPAGVTRLQVQALEGRRQPVVGAVVAVRGEDHPGRLHLVATDARGASRIADLPDGLYRVAFRKPGYATVVKDDVEVRSPLRTVIEVPMTADRSDALDEAPAVESPGTFAIDGAVRDVGGRPVPDVRIRWTHGRGGYDPVVVRTGPDGAFAIEALPAGPWRVEITGVGYLPIRTPVSVDRDLEVSIRMVGQPADYVASPLDLMPPEEPIAPPGFALPSEDLPGAAGGAVTAGR